MCISRATSPPPPLTHPFASARAIRYHRVLGVLALLLVCAHAVCWYLHWILAGNFWSNVWTIKDLHVATPPLILPNTTTDSCVIGHGSSEREREREREREDTWSTMAPLWFLNLFVCPRANISPYWFRHLSSLSLKRERRRNTHRSKRERERERQGLTLPPPSFFHYDNFTIPLNELALLGALIAAVLAVFFRRQSYELFYWAHQVFALIFLVRG